MRIYIYIYIYIFALIKSWFVTRGKFYELNTGIYTVVWGFFMLNFVIALYPLIKQGKKM